MTADLQSHNFERFSLDHLSATEFEEFSYALLHFLGFRNLSWRKGTGLNASPSDSGRDIECDHRIVDVDGSERYEHWFVECKHYRRGVPPDALQSLVAWATAQGPDVALIIVSNFLSNPAKEFLDKYKITHRPPFRIKVWERPDLEQLSAKYPQLIGRYGISPCPEFTRLLHVAHLFYINAMPMNTLDQLFSILDEIEPERRDKLLSWIYMWIGKPTFTPTSWPPRFVKDLVGPIATYESFREACYRMRDDHALEEMLIVQLILSHSLSCWFSLSDLTAVDRKIEDFKRMNLMIDEEIKKHPKRQRNLMGLRRINNERIENIASDMRRNYEEFYEGFCTEIAVPLLLNERVSDLINSEDFEKLRELVEGEEDQEL